MNRNPHLIATIGFFDGVHLGHRFLLNHLITSATQHNLTPAVITFGRHPREVVQPGFRAQLLTTLDEKIRLIKQNGIGECIVLDFDQEMAQLSARDFMQKILKEQLGVAKLIIGYDNKFGHNRSEDFNDYRKYGEEIGIDVYEAPQFAPGGERISSSAIRMQIEKGDIETANRNLGYDYCLTGKVVTGFQQGRKLGFPTANIAIDNSQKLLPHSGVYATTVRIDDSKTSLAGVTNIGTRPTFGGETLSIETHLPAFNGNLYGKTLHLSFVRYIRGERRFSSTEELRKQMEKDVNSIYNMIQQ